MPVVYAIDLSEDQKDEVNAEFNRVLNHPIFKSSKRCEVLLRYLVTRALSGNGDRIKERTLGIEAFGRDADYDTSIDPVVRVTANDIRKRLAQYYQESNDQHNKVRIQISRGSYLPEFEFLPDSEFIVPDAVRPFNERPHTLKEQPHALIEPPDSLILLEVGSTQTEAHPVFAGAPARHRWRFWVGAAVAAGVVGGIAIGIHHMETPRAIPSVLWQPLIASGKAVILCVPDDYSMIDPSSPNRTQVIAKVISSHQLPENNLFPVTPYLDAHVATNITSWLAQHQRQISLRRASRLTFGELSGSPVLLVGLTDNPWTLTLLSDLRYTAQIDPNTGAAWIEDRQNPAKQDWKLNQLSLYEGSYTDYGLVTRYFDKQTNAWLLAFGGLEEHGTLAAQMLLTEPAFENSLATSLPPNKNVQIVFKATVVNGNVSRPEILDVYTW